MSVAAKLRVLSSMDEIPRQDWDRLANPASCGSTREIADIEYNPFLSHDFLSALEQSGCATDETGWMARHMVLERDIPGGQTEIVGLMPCYLKFHSQGEYVFDHGWADAFERAGGDYYPKLQCSIPFTPATGRRLLVANDDKAQQNRQLLGSGLVQLCGKMNVSSAHLTFLPQQEWQLLGKQGYLLREDQQFHWRNDNYPDFDAFLASLNSRKRKTIRRERREALAGTGIEIDWLTGSDLGEDVWDSFFQFYIDTGSRKWGKPYLNRAFYSMIGERMRDNIVLIMARRQGRYIAGAINFIGSGTLYGRHWGCIEHHPFLHFEICYYQAIEWAIAHRLEVIEAGAQGAHKLVRGYLPKLTYSAHHITNQGLRNAVADYLEHERDAVEHENQVLEEHSPYRRR